MSPLLLVAMCAGPSAILLVGGRLAARSRLSLFVTSLTTWVVTTVALTWLVTDPSDVSAGLLVYFVLMPCAGAAIAAGVATRLVRTRGRLLTALTLSFLGWIAGIVVTVLAIRAAAWPHHVWDYALSVALPAIYAACGAVLAAGVRDRG